MTTPDPALILRRRFLWLLIAAAVPLLAALLFFGLRETAQVRADVLRGLDEAADLRLTLLEQLAAEVDTHTSVLRAFAEQRIAEEANLPEYHGALDWPPVLLDPGPTGGLVMGNPEAQTPDTRREMSAIVSIFALARATHATRPWLRWSYFFSDSRKYVAIYPWAPVAQMLDAGNPDAALASYFAYDLYTMGEPAKDRGRAAYWSPVYVDAGGAGLMVTHATPVWVDGQFRGIVGTDVLLSHPTQLLASLPPVEGKVAVIDQNDNIVAMSASIATAADGPVKAQAVLGDLDLSPTGAGFQTRGAALVSVAEIAGTPWRLVVAVPARTAQDAASTRMAPMGLLVAAVIFALVAAVAVVDRQFVTPAMTLADYGTRPSAEIVRLDTLPDLPAPFHPLVARIAEAARHRFAQTMQLRAMVDGVPLRVVYLDADLIYRDVNREFLTFLGKRADEVIGQHVRDILGPEVEAQYINIAPKIRRGEIGRFEGWIDYLIGGRRCLQVSILPFTAPGEETPGFLTFTLDQTELRLAEDEARKHNAALAEREELFRAVVVSALDAIVVMDDQGIVREFNPAAQAIFGHGADQAIGRPVGELIVPPVSRGAHEAGLARYLSGGDARVVGRRIEVEGMRKDGSLLPVELTVTEMQTGGRRLFVSHLRDLTQSQRLAREMQESRDRLHQVEKLSAMGSLLAGVAHELNNPLAIVVAQATLLVEKSPDSATRNRAERIRAAADRCGRIVKSFLAMARQKPPQREPTDVVAAIRTSLELIGYGLRSAGVEVALDLPATLPPVEGDRVLLGQVFSNLFINAQQALITRPLPRRITVSGRVEGEMLVLVIADNGPGVPEVVRRRIFDPYFTTKAVEVGTGIGLSISRNVIEAHGGSITLIEGQAESGATFEIRLPIAHGAIAAEAVPIAASGGQHFLIVDDETDVAESLAEMLGLWGHDATITGSAEAALRALERGPYDAVFTDLRMPGMDGADLAIAIQNRHAALAGRVVLMTGDTVAGPAHAAQRGAAEQILLEKPFTRAEIAAILHRLAGTAPQAARDV